MGGGGRGRGEGVQEVIAIQQSLAGGLQTSKFQDLHKFCKMLPLLICSFSTSSSTAKQFIFVRIYDVGCIIYCMVPSAIDGCNFVILVSDIEIKRKTRLHS